MNVFIVYWHPEPRSFNAALFATARDTLRAAGHVVQTSDLQAMGFDPVSGRHNFTTVHDPGYFKQQLEERHATEHHGFAPEIEQELQKLEDCDLMIWQFPLWWFGLPAVLKGWVDRVFAMGRTYGGGRQYGNGVFRGRRALLSLTTGGPQPVYAPEGFNGDIQGILRPIQRGMLEFVGFEVLAPHVVYGPVRLSDAERRAKLQCYAERLRTIESEAPIVVGQY
ncbi:MAG: NAD(P)H-dependent oxidoreductase [Candidatus Competibacterales bacterium]|nr:NAD(P)H-dependent oxidoreductase [Candidatus Competibacterales bacterium]